MRQAARILIVGEAVEDAKLLRDMLLEQFDSVEVTTDPTRTLNDFKAYKPNVLVFAFESLEKSERAYLGLYRLGSEAQHLSHRALILCDKGAVDDAYKLCRAGHFDDYILFWPLGYDTRRLFMAVTRAVRDLAMQATTPSISNLAAQSRHLAALESELNQCLAQGNEYARAANAALADAEMHIGSALDQFSDRILLDAASGPALDRDSARIRSEVEIFKTLGIQPHLRAVRGHFDSIEEWMTSLGEVMCPGFDSVRSLGAIPERPRPRILVVDDDGLQCKILAQLLRNNGYDAVFAASGARALAVAQQQQPRLILMDFNMPDLDGIEVTRRLKAMDDFVEVPIIMMTGQSEEDVVIGSLEAGAEDFVVKPFAKETLLNKLEKYLK